MFLYLVASWQQTVLKVNTQYMTQLDKIKKQLFILKIWNAAYGDQRGFHLRACYIIDRGLKLAFPLSGSACGFWDIGTYFMIRNSVVIKRNLSQESLIKSNLSQEQFLLL